MPSEVVDEHSSSVAVPVHDLISEQINHLQNQAFAQNQQMGSDEDVAYQSSATMIDDLPPWHLDETEQGVSLAADRHSENSSVQQFNPNSITAKHQPEAAPNSDDLTQVESSQAKQGVESLAVVEQAEFAPSGDYLQDWISIIQCLDLKGMAEDMARNSVLVELTDKVLRMSIDPEQQYAKPEMVLEQIEAAVKTYFGTQMVFEVVGASEHFTPVKYEQKLAEDKQLAAQQSIANDGVVNSFLAQLGMDVIPGTLKPL
ncbi:DNA polymerase III subunit gamma/tau C-terminal domain-containing protein [Thiomicrorhabdus immobilis]